MHHHKKILKAACNTLLFHSTGYAVINKTQTRRGPALKNMALKALIVIINPQDAIN